ncbi:MAG: HEAT repeat domain-containing protein [Deltaproteobacteria bacterium]|nr:HEAT repeat domain-containing protein [Deltaproteobacteria bacterium]
MRSVRRTLPPHSLFRRLALAFALLAMLTPAMALADAKIDELADKLRNASDFRVRTQAALALGATNDQAAVKPLCDGLDDSNTAVRTAAAAALGKLGQKSALPCLKAKVPNEGNASVSAQIKRSITQLEGARVAHAAKAPDASSKWYIAVGATKTKGDRSTTETDNIVQEAARSGLISTSGCAVAPAGETPAQANGVISKYKLKAYFLQPTVEEPKYEGGKLTIVVRMTMFSYPNRSLQGEFAPKLTQSGTPSKDKDSEDALIKMAVSRAIESFVKVAQSSN